MDYHEWLYRTRWLMTEVEAAMSNLAGHLQTEDSLPNLFYNGEADALLISSKHKELMHKLRRCNDFIGEAWTQIVGSPPLRRMACRHVTDYRRIRNSFLLLHSLLDQRPEYEHRLFGESQWRDYMAIRFAELNDDMVDILYEFSGMPMPQGLPAIDLSGIAGRLEMYVYNVTDDFYADIILRHVIPAEKTIWHGVKANCARFCRHFGIRDDRANRIFTCVKGGKRLGPLKISSDCGRNGDDAYAVEAILRLYPYELS